MDETPPVPSPHHQEQISTLVARVAEVIAVVSTSNSSNVKTEAVVASLLEIISGLTKLARTVSHLEGHVEREQEATRLLKKFKKVAKQQQELIELHEASIKDAEIARFQHLQQVQQLQQELRSAPVTASTQVNTDLTIALIANMEGSSSMMVSTLKDLKERNSQCSQLDEQLRSSVAENRKLRIVVKRAQGVIEAQRVLLDSMADARKRGGAPSREHTPVRIPSRHIQSLRAAPTAIQTSLPLFPNLREDGEVLECASQEIQYGSVQSTERGKLEDEMDRGEYLDDDDFDVDSGVVDREQDRRNDSLLTAHCWQYAREYDELDDNQTGSRNQLQDVADIDLESSFDLIQLLMRG